jgi:hypothetical protein
MIKTYLEISNKLKNSPEALNNFIKSNPTAQLQSHTQNNIPSDPSDPTEEESAPKFHSWNRSPPTEKIINPTSLFGAYIPQ